MFHEGGPRAEKDVSREALPTELAEKFVDGAMIDGAPMVHRGDKSDIYRCFERPVVLPEMNAAALRIDYRKYHEVDPQRPNQLRFEYTEAQKPVVEMHLGLLRPDFFVLEHRYVAPHLRKAGLGSQLYGVVDGWLHQLADARGMPVDIGLQTGQESVMRWAEKMDFDVREDQKDLLGEIRNHPERFEQDSVVLSDESREQGVVKDLYTFRKGESGRYMENAVRLTFLKQIRPSEGV